MLPKLEQAYVVPHVFVTLTVTLRDFAVRMGGSQCQGLAEHCGYQPCCGAQRLAFCTLTLDLIHSALLSDKDTPLL
jgi:hypothetical protein